MARLRLVISMNSELQNFKAKKIRKIKKMLKLLLLFCLSVSCQGQKIRPNLDKVIKSNYEKQEYQRTLEQQINKHHIESVKV